MLFDKYLSYSIPLDWIYKIISVLGLPLNWISENSSNQISTIKLDLLFY